MSARLTDTELQRFFDGDLPPAEKARIEEALRADEDARTRIEALGEMRALLREAVEARAAEAAIDVWAGVRAGIQRPPSSAERIGEWLRSRWAMPVVAAAAAAAVVAAVSIVASRDEPRAPVVEIEEIESDGPPPTIVMTSAEPGETAIPVVWIEEK